MRRKIRMSSIIDPIQDSLNRYVFDGNQMRPKVRKEILDGAEVIRNHSPHIDWRGIYAIGSSMGYQYRPNSDIDINIHARNVSEEDRKITNRMISESNGLWYIGGHPINYHLNTEPFDARRTVGIYDIINDKWVKSPARPKHDAIGLLSQPAVEEEYRSFLDRLNVIRVHLAILCAKCEHMDDGDIRQQVQRLNAEVDKLDVAYSDLAQRRRDTFDGPTTDSDPNLSVINLAYKLIEKDGLLDLSRSILHSLGQDKHISNNHELSMIHRLMAGLNR